MMETVKVKAYRSRKSEHGSILHEAIIAFVLMTTVASLAYAHLQNIFTLETRADRKLDRLSVISEGLEASLAARGEEIDPQVPQKSTSDPAWQISDGTSGVKHISITWQFGTRQHRLHYTAVNPVSFVWEPSR